jgi:hypothetical protein
MLSALAVITVATAARTSGRAMSRHTPRASLQFFLLLALVFFTSILHARADEICTVNENTTIVIKTLELERFLAFGKSQMLNQARQSIECIANKGDVVLVSSLPLINRNFVHVEVQEKRSAFEKWLKQFVPYCSGWASRASIDCPSWRPPQAPQRAPMSRPTLSPRDEFWRRLEGTPDAVP